MSKIGIAYGGKGYGVNLGWVLALLAAGACAWWVKQQQASNDRPY